MRDEAKRTAAMVARALEAGADFARDAWRDVGVVLGLSAIAGAVVFVADHANLPHGVAGLLRGIGWSGLALVLAPKLGALYRAALGGPGLSRLGPGGLQWRRMEWRLLGTTVALFAFGVIVLLPLLALFVATLAVLRPLGVVELGPLGPLGLGFLLAAPVFLALAAAAFTGLARLAVTLPAEAAEAQPRFARGWFVTRRWSLATALVAALAFVGPLAALTGLQAGLDWMQAGDGPGLGRQAWPLADAVVAGLVLGGLTEFLAAPFCVGAFADLYLALVSIDPVATAPPDLAAVDGGPGDALEPASSQRFEDVQAAEAVDPLGADDVAPAEGSPITEEAATPPRRPSLRLVHSVDTIATPWRPLAPKHVAGEAEASHAAPSQEPSGP